MFSSSMAQENGNIHSISQEAENVKLADYHALNNSKEPRKGF